MAREDLSTYASLRRLQEFEASFQRSYEENATIHFKIVKMVSLGLASAASA